MSKIAPCLWFDTNAEEAVAFYLSVFPGSRLVDTTRYPRSDHPAHAGREGSVMVVTFEMFGQRYTALNGGPYFQFNEAVSLQVFCDSQAEIDDYWAKLSKGGDARAQQCGWLKDKFGLSWQIVPREMAALFQGSDAAANQRVMQALLSMRKLDIAMLKAASSREIPPTTPPTP